jgi:voltage-gated potassium channel
VTGTEADDKQAQHSERWELLRTLDRVLEGPLIVLSFVWLAVLLAEFVVGTDVRFDVLVYAIWVVFIIEVAIELVIAPDRLGYLRGNWLKVISLAIPALRALRVLTALRFLRAARAVRSASLLRLLTSLNRGMGALGRTLDRARFVYVVALTVLVIVIGAGGLLFFEREAAAELQAAGERGMTSYGEALWWTAMAMTTVGTDYFPVTAEGRLLGWLLSVFAIGVFGYVTATMAGHFLGIEAAPSQPAREDLLTRELSDLRNEIAALRQRLPEAID